MIRASRPALLAVLASLLAAGPAAPLRAQTKQSSSLDDQLMKRLRAEPLDDVDRELFGPDQKQPGQKEPGGKQPGQDQPAGKPAPPTQGEDLKQRLSRELGSAAISEDDNPLVSIARQMRDVESLIAQTQSGQRTQQAQQRIVADLDKLIQQARKRCRQCSSPNTPSQATAGRPKINQPSAKPAGAQAKRTPNPAQVSNAKPGRSKTKKADVAQVRALIGKWGALPERERQQLLDLPMEEFLPKYESLIIEYFKRLSEAQGKEKR